eukprot:1698437-Pleurochrysis_carterae.AAC.2
MHTVGATSYTATPDGHLRMRRTDCASHRVHAVTSRRHDNLSVATLRRSAQRSQIHSCLTDSERGGSSRRPCLRHRVEIEAKPVVWSGRARQHMRYGSAHARTETRMYALNKDAHGRTTAKRARMQERLRRRAGLQRYAGVRKDGRGGR